MNTKKNRPLLMNGWITRSCLTQISRLFGKSSYWAIITVLAALFITILCLTAAFASAKDGSERTKQVTSVYIQRGDTLWEIASRYQTVEYPNLQDYIHEIKSCNGLYSDDIHAGQYIIVPYYKDAN